MYPVLKMAGIHHLEINVIYRFGLFIGILIQCLYFTLEKSEEINQISVDVIVQVFVWVTEIPPEKIK